MDITRHSKLREPSHPWNHSSSSLLVFMLCFALAEAPLQVSWGSRGNGSSPRQGCHDLTVSTQSSAVFKQTCLVCFGLVARVTNLFCLNFFLHYSCFFEKRVCWPHLTIAGSATQIIWDFIYDLSNWIWEAGTYKKIKIPWLEKDRSPVQTLQIAQGTRSHMPQLGVHMPQQRSKIPHAACN